MSVVVVAHQPQFLPYLGLYNKILQSNKFIFLDDVKFKNSSWHARTIVKNHQDHTVQLIIPCSKKNSSSYNIKDIVIRKKLK